MKIVLACIYFLWWGLSWDSSFKVRLGSNLFLQPDHFLLDTIYRWAKSETLLIFCQSRSTGLCLIFVMGNLGEISCVLCASWFKFEVWLWLFCWTQYHDQLRKMLLIIFYQSRSTDLCVIFVMGNLSEIYCVLFASWFKFRCDARIFLLETRYNDWLSETLLIFYQSRATRLCLIFVIGNLGAISCVLLNLRLLCLPWFNFRVWWEYWLWHEQKTCSKYKICPIGRCIVDGACEL